MVMLDTEVKSQKLKGMGLHVNTTAVQCHFTVVLLVVILDLNLKYFIC